MKRTPVTKASYKKIPKKDNGNRSHSPKGVPGMNVTVGKPDKEKTDAARYASYVGWGGFGMGMGRPTMIGASSNFYNNTYMNGGRTGAFGDVPPGIALLMEQNGGVLYYPTTLKERYQYYRWFYSSDAYVHAAVDLNTDLPMSRLQLRMPKMNDKALSRRILHFYEDMVNELHLYDKLHSILFENAIIGNSYAFVEYDEKKKRWGRIVLLPPEEVNVANFPLSDVKRIQYRPEVLSATVRKYSLDVSGYDAYVASVKALPEADQDILRDVSFELVKQILENNGVLEFDSDPYTGDGGDLIGSFVFHFANKRHDYQDLGVSPLECVMQPLLQKTHYKYTQTSLASRNMTPRDLIVADGVTPEALDDLRVQVDESMLSPDYKIVTNYPVDWQQIGAENRLIDLGREYETIENELFAGLGVTRELLTGEGMYSGSHISIEILNTKYLIVREMLQRFVEESLFKPVALQNGFYHDDEDGFRTWYYPKLGFTRLTIRDNQEVFDQLFQLYQKGSLPIEMILDIFNINADDVNEALEHDLFTVRDATFNEMLRQVYSSVGDKIVESTDLAKQVAESLTGPAGHKLKYRGEDAGMDEGLGDDGGLGGEGGAADDLMDKMNSLDEEAGGEEEPFTESGEGSSAPSGEQSGDSGEQSADDAVREYVDAFREESRARKYLDGIVGEGASSSSSSSSAPSAGNGEVLEYLRGVREEGRARDYIDRVKEEEGTSGGSAGAYESDSRRGNPGMSEPSSDAVEDYLRKVRQEDAASEYVDRITRNVADEKARSYIDRVTGEDDEAARKYIDSFLGEGAEDDDGDAAQSAGIDDYKERRP